MAATVRQLSLIDSLVAEKGVTGSAKDTIYEIARRPDADPKRGGPISQVIDGLLAMPRPGSAARPAGGQGVAAPVRENAWVAAGIPCARYVLNIADPMSGEELCLGETDARPLFGGNRDIFVEVREFKGTRYVRQLHGAPGSYTRSKPTFAAQVAIRKALEAVGPLRATNRYGAMYTCCSVCGAELTDDTSRELRLGPVCRTRFGL